MNTKIILFVVAHLILFSLLTVTGDEMTVATYKNWLLTEGEYTSNQLNQITYPSNTPANIRQAINTTFLQTKFTKRSLSDRFFSKLITNTSVVIVYDIQNANFSFIQDPCQLKSGYYNWVITEDLQITFGSFQDAFEW